jgi:hypothetical protein
LKKGHEEEIQKYKELLQKEEDSVINTNLPITLVLRYIVESGVKHQ